MGGEQEVAEEHRSGRCVGDGEVVIGVSGGSRLQRQAPPAKVELLALIHRQSRSDDAGSGKCRSPNIFAIGGEVALGA